MNLISQIVTNLPFLLLAPLATTCLNQHSSNLSKISQYDIKIDEPSGLALDPTGAYLWIVSDHSNKVYKTNLEGDIIDHFDTKSKDSEGIAISSDGKEVYVLDEETRRIFGYTIEGKKTESWQLDLKTSGKSGPEGLDINPTTGNFLVVNEKNPRIYLELNQEGDELISREVGLLSDLSAIAYDADTQDTWLLSDQDQKLVQISSDDKVLQTFSIDIDQMEGLAIDFTKKIFYIVSDSEEELHIFQYK